MEHLHQPGDLINQRYRILEILGKGGISVTYKAVDEQINQPVAIKALSLRQTQDWKIIELFEREARVLQNLNHPAIPNYLDYFQIDTTDDRYFYIVQEVAEGQSLAEWIKQGWRPSEKQVRQIAQKILKTLIYLHQLNPPVIHRDIKPRNIILQSNGRVFLVDFGAVKDTYRQTMTAGSTVVGTYGYMAPEQFRGQAKPATDLYGLAATLLFLLTRTSPADLPEKRLKIDFRPAVNISSDLADWLDRMLEPSTDDRFQNAKEALAVLRGEREIIYPLVHSNRQPAGSKIKFKKTANKLTIHLPPSSELRHARVKNIRILFALIVTLGLGFLYFPPLILCSIIIFVVWFFWTADIDLLGDEIYLEIDRQDYCLKTGSLFITLKKAGKTADLKIIQPSEKMIDCELTEWNYYRTYYFGKRMTQEEKIWLMTEIYNFLIEIK